MGIKYSERSEKLKKTRFITLQNCVGEIKEKIIDITLIETVKCLKFSDEERKKMNSERSITFIKGLVFKLSNGEEITTMSVDAGEGIFVLDLYYNADCTPVRDAYELSDILNSMK